MSPCKNLLSVGQAITFDCTLTASLRSDVGSPADEYSIFPLAKCRSCEAASTQGEMNLSQCGNWRWKTVRVASTAVDSGAFSGDCRQDRGYQHRPRQNVNIPIHQLTPNPHGNGPPPCRALSTWFTEDEVERCPRLPLPSDRSGGRDLVHRKVQL